MSQLVEESTRLERPEGKNWGGARPGAGRKPNSQFAPLPGDLVYAKALVSKLMRDETQPVGLRARCALAILTKGISHRCGSVMTGEGDPRNHVHLGPLLTTPDHVRPDDEATPMASVAEAVRTPRYGSAAELASYAGLSVKTIRRLVDAGKVRGKKVGRRLVIPFEDLDSHILEIGDEPPRPTMQATRPRPTFDARGRALPLPADEERWRAVEAIRVLDALASMGDDQEQSETFAALAEAIDQDRMSDRRRFAE